MTDDMTGHSRVRLLVLASGVFTLGLSEFMIAGLLGTLSASLHKPEPVTAILVTAFAAAVVVSAPVTAALTLRLRPSLTLTTAMAVFAAAHLVTALSTSFWTALVMRIVAGVACGAYLSVSNVVAARMVEPSRAPRAIAVLIGGLTISNVLGLPAAGWIGAAWGWQAMFILVAALGVVSCVALLCIGVPAPPGLADASLTTEARVLARPALLATFAVVVLFQATLFATFTYLQPLTSTTAGHSPTVSGVLLGVFGLGTLAGVTLGGAVAHRGLLRNMAASLAVTMISLGLLQACLDRPVVWVGAAVFLFGTAAFSICAALNGQVFALAADAPTLASGMNIGMLNLGNAAGPAIAGAWISASGGHYQLAIWTSLICATLALLSLTATRLLGAGQNHSRDADHDTKQQVPIAASAAATRASDRQPTLAGSTSRLHTARDGHRAESQA